VRLLREKKQRETMEEQIQKEIWNGWIPIVLYLARDEIASPQGVEPYFVGVFEKKFKSQTGRDSNS
jgi:hypothetical protein